MANIAWILGSGFSRPLGGPTLKDLFAPQAEDALAALYGRTDSGITRAVFERAQSTVVGELPRAVRRLYNMGTNWALGPMAPRSGEHLWEDPEQFLDALESAAFRVAKGEASAAARSLLQKLQLFMDANTFVKIGDVCNIARRMLAVECSFFLHEADTTSERWDPFRRWKEVMTDNSLGHHHTVITFNYDRVLERLGLGTWARLPKNAAEGGPAIFKLHGSVDWRRKGAELEVLEDEEDAAHFVVTCRDDALAIAPPGPGKQGMVDDLLEPLWREALARLRTADVVFFVGYRFPQTDAMARRRILGAISNVRVHNIVLGPDERDPDVVRLRALLKFGSPNIDAIVRPMWSQDYLSVFPTGHLAVP